MVAVFTINNINHNFEMNDFKVYYSAANALTHNQPLYDNLFTLGSGYYKYSPFTALLFCPYTLLPYHLACSLHFFFISISILLTSLLLFRLLGTQVFKNNSLSSNLLITLAFICVINHLVRELTVGNINLILLLLLCFALFSVLRGKTLIPSLLLAIAIITKPFFILFLAPLFLHKHYKVIAGTIITLVLLCVLPALLKGFGGNLQLQKEWLNAVFLHANTFPSDNMLISLFKTYIYAQIPNSFQYIILLLFAGAAYFFAWKIYPRQKEKEADATSQFIVEWFILLAIIPSLFTTDTEHFLMTWPLITYILFYLFTYKNKLLSVLFILVILMYDTNSRDLLGSSLSHKMEECGILGISNLLLLVIALIIFYRQRALPSKHS